MHKQTKNKLKNKYSAVAIVFAGGGGTRLWPLSNSKLPKQFLSLVDERTLFRTTIERLMTIFDPEDIFVSITREIKNYVLEEFPELNPQNLIVEPSKRDTGPAICLAFSYIKKLRGNVPVFSAWSDHIMDEGKKFEQMLKGSIAISDIHQKFLSIGIRPIYPTSKYGYIQMGKFIDRKGGVELYNVKKFHEKPDIEEAKKFVNRWDFLWNAGMFACNAEVLINYYKKYSKEILDPIEKIISYTNTEEYESKLNELYEQCPKISFDYAITEKLDFENEMLLIPISINWLDIGSWDVIYDTGFKDENQNVVKGNGEFIGVNSRKNLSYQKNKRKLVALFNVKGLTIVDTKDVLMICPTKDAEKLKDLVSRLRDRNGNSWL